MSGRRPSLLDRAGAGVADAAANSLASAKRERRQGARLSASGLLAGVRRRVSDAMPAPLAAPETVRLRRLRLYLLALLAWIGLLTFLFPSLHRFAPMITVLVWQASALAALGTGFIWVRDKNRADDAWLMREEED